MEGTVTRSYDVSHLTRRCEVCGAFDRHVNQRVIDQYEAFEADPPTALDWDALDRTRKFIVAERVARQGRSVESLAPDRDDRDAETAAADGASTDTGDDDRETPTGGDERATDADVHGDDEDGDGTGAGDVAADGDTDAGDPAPAERDSSPSGSG